VWQIVPLFVSAGCGGIHPSGSPTAAAGEPAANGGESGQGGSTTPKGDGGAGETGGSRPDAAGGSSAGEAGGGGVAGQTDEAGAAGVGGDAGHPDACDDLGPCQDENPCTVDRCDAELGCQHLALVDGELCDDGDACTSNDACSAGVCAGEPRLSQPQILSTVYSYASYRDEQPAWAWAPLVLPGGRIVFADWLSSGTSLTLTRVENGQLKVLDRVTTLEALSNAEYSTWVWRSYPTAGLSALSDTRFLLSGAPGAQFVTAVFDIEGDKLIERSRLSERGNVSDLATGRGSRIFKTSYYGFSEYAVDEAGALGAAKFHSHGSPGCSHLKLSPDGRTLYCGGSNGLRRWDVSGEAPIALERLFQGSMIIGLDVNEQYLALQLVGPQRQPGDARVYRLSDWALVASLSPTPQEEPLGAALVGDRLLVQWEQHLGERHRLVSKTYDLDEAGAHLAGERVGWDRCCNDRLSFESVRIATAGDLAVLSPLQHVVRVDAQGGQEWIRGVGQGSFARVEAGQAGQLLAVEPYAAHALDTRTPSALALLGGGLFPVYDSRPNSWFVTAAEELHPLGFTAADGAGVTLLGIGASESASPLAPLALGSPELPLQASGSTIMQVSFEGDRCHLAKYAISGPVDHAQPRLLSTWEIDLPGGHVEGKPFRFSYDAVSRQLAIVTDRDGDGQSGHSLSWLGEQDGAMRVLGHREGPESALGIKLAAGKVALLSPSKLSVLGLTAEVVQVEGEWPIDSVPPALIDFDGRRSYVAGALGGTFGLIVYESGRATPLTLYPTVDVPRSVVAIGELLGIGMDSAVSLAAPACSNQ
jgi:hypothetical protein